MPTELMKKTMEGVKGEDEKNNILSTAQEKDQRKKVRKVLLDV